jgi:hypothetical protein
MLNPFLHSEMDFEQQKIVIRVNLYRLLGKINVHMCIVHYVV